MLTKIAKTVESLFPNGFMSFEGSYSKGFVRVGLIRNICEVSKDNNYIKSRAFRREDPLSLEFELDQVGDLWRVNVVANVLMLRDGSYVHCANRTKHMGDESSTLIFLVRMLEQVHSRCSEYRVLGQIRHMGTYPNKYFQF